jgi:hypothetical protein
MHIHANEDESWYVLAGDLRFSLDGELAAAAVGSFVFVPHGAPHCFQSSARRSARLLVLFTPSGMERFFERFAALLPAGRFDPESFRTAGAEAGMDVDGPALSISHGRRPA